MTTPSEVGPEFTLPITRTLEYTITCYEADTTTPLVVEANDVFRFKVWLTDDAAPQIDADNVALLTDTFTTTFATDLFTSTSDHNLSVGDALHFSNSGGALPDPLQAETAYWVIETPAASTFKVSTTKGGSTVTLTDDGTGTHTWTQRKSSVTVVTVGVPSTTPAQVTVTLDQVDTAQLTADTDYNYELALVDDDDGNRIKPIIRGTFRTDGSPSGGDIGTA